MEFFIERGRTTSALLSPEGSGGQVLTGEPKNINFEPWRESI